MTPESRLLFYSLSLAPYDAIENVTDVRRDLRTGADFPLSLSLTLILFRWCYRSSTINAKALQLCIQINFIFRIFPHLLFAIVFCVFHVNVRVPDSPIFAVYHSHDKRDPLSTHEYVASVTKRFPSATRNLIDDSVLSRRPRILMCENGESKQLEITVTRCLFMAFSRKIQLIIVKERLQSSSASRGKKEKWNEFRAC